MRKVVLVVLGVIVVLGLLAASGFAGYRFGYAQGLQATANGSTARPGLRPFNNFNFGPRGMPMRRFGMERGFGRGGFPMWGFAFFGLFGILVRIAVLVLFVWFVWWLIARSGWRLTRTTQATTTTPPPPASAEGSGQDKEVQG